MRSFSIRAAAAIAIAATFALGPGARADTITYDTSLASPGVYFGTGNSGQNADFTVSNGSNGIEIGLKAIDRFVGGIAPTSTNVYNVSTGDTTVPGEIGAAWGFDFSVNTHPAGVGTLTLGDIAESLSVTDELTGQTRMLPPYFIFDNAVYGPAGTFAGSSGCSGSLACLGSEPSQWGFQNSESLSFAWINTLLDPSFNDALNDTYLINLTVSNAVKPYVQYASDTIEVVAGTGAPIKVPEPASIALLATGLVLLFFVALWRRSLSATSAAS